MRPSVTSDAEPGAGAYQAVRDTDLTREAAPAANEGRPPENFDLGSSVPSAAPPEKKSAAAVLVDLALERYEFGVSTDGESFAIIRPDGSAVEAVGPHVVRMLRGGQTSLRTELAAAYRRETGKVPGQQALADALLVLEGIAQEAEPAPVAVRVAADPEAGCTWLDLGDKSGRVIAVTVGGWSIHEQTGGTLFRRTRLTGALPVPLPGGDLADLWRLLNVAEDDRPLVLAWLVAAIILPEAPHPVLALFGEQGTGKSTATRRLVELVDPSPVPLRKAPKDADSWVTAALGSWVVALDNLSAIPAWLSDSLCRAVTGDGDVRRQLYTDAGLSVFAFRRAVLLNGIDVGALRGDLADRALMVNLETIPEADRLPEADMSSEWASAYPFIVGALLDQCGQTLALLPSVRLDGSPRMADFARVVEALDRINGTEGYARYLDQTRTLAEDTITSDPFLSELAGALTEPFEGTAADLLAAATPTHEGWRPPRDWPSARGVTGLLKRNAPGLRKLGWTVDNLGRRGHANASHWRIVPTEFAGKPCRTCRNAATSGGEMRQCGNCGNGSGQTQDDRGDPNAPAGDCRECGRELGAVDLAGICGLCELAS